MHILTRYFSISIGYGKRNTNSQPAYKALNVSWHFQEQINMISTEPLTLVILLTIFGCTQTRNNENELKGESKLNIWDRNDGVKDIFGPRLAFEF
jgi:hypothetical protein